MLVTAGTFVTLVGYEHYAKINKYKRPSEGLTYIANKSHEVFTSLGRMIAYCSSFYHYLRLGELKDTLCELGEPIGLIIISPFYTFKGYLDVLTKNDYPVLTIFGSATLLLIAIGLIYKYPSMIDSVTHVWSTLRSNVALK